MSSAASYVDPINAEYREVVKAERAALPHAIKCGELLNLAKENVKAEKMKWGEWLMSHTHSEIGGRYAGVGAQMVVGADPIPKYPAAAAHQHDPCGLEPPLGYRIDAMPEHEPPEPFPLSQAQGNSGDLTAQQGISPRDLSSPPFRRMK